MSRHTTHGIQPLPDQDWDDHISQHARASTPRGRLMTWATGLLAVAAFFAVIHMAERNPEQASRMAAINAQMDATDARLQRAAALLCQAEAGPGAQVLWTQDGDLVCRPAVMTAQVRP